MKLFRPTFFVVFSFFPMWFGSIMGNELRNERKEPVKEAKPDHTFQKLKVDLLQKLLKASPEQLRLMRKTIEKVESMNSEQKRAMARRLLQLRNSSAEDRLRVFSRINNRMKILKEYWAGLEPEERKLEIKRFYEMRDTERSDYLLRIQGKRKPQFPSQENDLRNQ